MGLKSGLTIRSSGPGKDGKNMGGENGRLGGETLETVYTKDESGVHEVILF